MSNYWPTNYWAGTTSGASLDTPTLSIADNEDGTGAVATVADATVGTTNTVYYQTFVGQVGSGAWTNGGSRTGNGTVSLSLSTGHYLAHVKSVSGDSAAASAVSYFVVTSTTEAISYQCLTAAQTRIRALTLDDVASASIVVKKLPLERVKRNDTLTLPMILITPARETTPESGVTTHDDYGHGVMVTIIDDDNQESTLAANLNKYQLWREKIMHAFRNQRLAGVSSVHTARIEPHDPVIPPAWRAGLFASALLIRFMSRETRGM